MYVTKDKRINKSKGKKYLWWFICLALVLALVIVALLAATGVIFKASPTTPVESRTFGDDKSNVNAAGFFTPVNRTDPTMPPLPVPEDLTDTVPNVVQGQLTFQNMKFDDRFNDPDDPEYKKLTDSIIGEIETALGVNRTDGNVTITITDLK